MTTISTRPKFVKMSICTSIVGALMIVAFIAVEATDFPLNGAGLLLFLGIMLLVGGITGGVWVSQSQTSGL